MDRVTHLSHGGLKRYRSSESSADVRPTASADSSCLPLPSPRPAPSPSTSVDRLVQLSKQVGADVSYVYQTRLETAKNQDLRLDITRLNAMSRTRNEFVDFISSSGESFRLRKATTHVAVQYLDRIISKLTRVSMKDMLLLSLACIRLAAKFEEAHDMVPSTPCLLETVATRGADLLKRNDLTVHDVNDMELALFRSLDYKMFALTPVHFLELFSIWGIFYSPAKGDMKQTPRRTSTSMMTTSADNVIEKKSDRTVLKDVTERCEFFVDLAQQHGGRFLTTNVARMACVALSCARRSLGVIPTWSSHLEATTTFVLSKDDEMQSLHDELYGLYENQYATSHHPERVEEEPLQEQSSQNSQQEEDLDKANEKMAAMMTAEAGPSKSSTMLISPLGCADLFTSMTVQKSTAMKLPPQPPAAKSQPMKTREPLASIDFNVMPSSKREPR